jgi:hypothetical protein
LQFIDANIFARYLPTESRVVASCSTIFSKEVQSVVDNNLIFRLDDIGVSNVILILEIDFALILRF